MNKIVSGKVSSLILICMLVLPLCIQAGKATFTEANKLFDQLIPEFIDLYGGAENNGYGSFPDPFPDPFGGRGWHQPMDLVTPRSEVIFYAWVAYNMDPVAYDDVTFLIEGPQGYSYAMYARTGENGIAYVTFEMPWPRENPEGLMGIWNVTATTYVNGVEVVDVMSFFYGYMVDILGVTTNKLMYERGESVEMTVTYGTFSMQYYPALFSIYVLDSLKAQIGSIFRQYAVGGAPYGHMLFTEFSSSITIPLYANAGYADITVDCFDKDPGIGGLPWCPQYQKESAFTIQGAPHDVAVYYVVASQSQVTVGDSLHVSVFVNNFGTQTETFSVTAYRGSGKVGFDTETVTLVAGETRTLDMVWDTTGVVPNTYQIGAYASQVPGETNLANNDYQDGTVTIVGLPYPPKNLLAEPINNGISLTWMAPDKSGVQDYYIFRGATPDFEISWPNYHARVDGNKQQFTDTIFDDKIYYYKVIASYQEGLSKHSNEVACARAESVKGIASKITGVRSLSVPLLNYYSLQQNFFLFTGKKDAQGNPIVYWCQNAINCLQNYYQDGTCYAVMYIFQYNWNTGEKSRVPTRGSLYIPWKMAFVPDTLYFKSKITGGSLEMSNSIGSWAIDKLDLSSDAFICTIPYPYGSARIIDSPNFDVVAGGIFLPGQVRDVTFTDGEGWVSCKVEIGGKWIPAFKQLVWDNIFSATEEMSTGLQWEISAYEAHFYYQDKAHNFKGVFFQPDFNAKVTQEDMFQPLGTLVNYIVLLAMCPVYFNLYDEFGNCVGYNATSGNVVFQIDNALWESNQTIIVFNPTGMYRLIVVGTEDGTFTLQIVLQDKTGSIMVLLNETDTITRKVSKAWAIAPGPEGNYTASAISSLSVSMSPILASILVGQSVTFTSTVSGGITPYSFQWFLNGNPVSGATLNTWTFTPASSGIYYVYLKVTDAIGNTAQSDTARITVATVPVGGYSIPIPGQATEKPITPYVILTAFLTIAYTTIKRKTTRKPKKYKFMPKRW